MLGSVVGNGLKWGAKGVANAEKVADTVKLGSRIVGDGGAMLLSGGQAVESAKQVYTNITNGEGLTWKNAVDVITLGISVAGMGMAGASIAKSGKSLKAMYKGETAVSNVATSNATKGVSQARENAGQMKMDLQLFGGKSGSKIWDYSKQFDGELANFNDGYKIKNVVDKDLYLVQLHSNAEVGRGRSLKYWTTFDEANGISTIDDYMDKMALMSNWGARDNVSIAKIPAGTKIKYAIGTAKKQVGAIESRPGGGLQMLFEQFNDSWVLETRPLP